MALQDIAPFDPAQLVDPTTGKPYAYGSPQYEAALAPYLTEQLRREAERGANARGAFYSGPAMADEQQATSNMLYQMEQQGAQQALQESEMLQQEGFQAQQQAAQNQASMDLARRQGAEERKAAAIQGGLSSAGTLGGLYLMRPGGFFNAGAAPVGPGAGANAALAAPTMGPGSTELAGSLTATDPELASAVEAPAASGAAPAAGGLSSLVPGLGTAASGAAGGLLGYQVGGGPHSGVAPELGGGLGGLAGMEAGMMVAPALGPAAPLAPFAGAALGAWGGRNIGNWLSHLF